MSRFSSFGAALGAILLTTAAIPAEQKTFATPDEAAKALIAAAEKFDTAALKEILGPAGEDLVVTEDPVQDRNQSAEFAARAHEKMQIARDPKNRSLASLVVGHEDWPMPIPIVQKGGRWSFDVAKGRQEILYRRIGTNELDAIQVCHGFVEAQHEYALEKHDESPVNQYAQKIIATKGKHDGLAWQDSDGSWRGPVGEAVARAISEGYGSQYEPYHGYYYKVLKGQGPAARLGTLDYVVKGAMIGGFALAAAPADYAVSGVKTFIVSNEGVVYEKDLGPATLEQFKSMDRYNPDKTWSRVEGN